MPFQFINVVANGWILFTFYIHLSISFIYQKTLRLFLFFGYHEKCLNKHENRISLSDSDLIFFGYISRSIIAGSHGNSKFHSWGSSRLLSIMAIPVHIPNNISTLKGGITYLCEIHFNNKKKTKWKLKSIMSFHFWYFYFCI